MTQLAKDDFDTYASYWKDIALFVKYGMMKEDRFYDRAKDALIFETTDGEFLTLDKLAEGDIYYTPGKNDLTVYVDRLKQDGKTVIVMDHEIDNQFMSFIEYKSEGKTRFVRVDAELGKAEEGLEEKQQMLEKRFRQAAGDDKLKVRLVALGENALPAMIEESEQSRRMSEMKKQLERLGQTDFDDQMFADVYKRQHFIRLFILEIVHDARAQKQVDTGQNQRNDQKIQEHVACAPFLFSSLGLSLIHI